jgi:hypothetical protein
MDADAEAEWRTAAVLGKAAEMAVVSEMTYVIGAARLTDNLAVVKSRREFLRNSPVSLIDREANPRLSANAADEHPLLTGRKMAEAGQVEVDPYESSHTSASAKRCSGS